MNVIDGQALRLVPLGGLGKFGLNALVLEWAGQPLLVDAGLMFPGAEMLGGWSPISSTWPSAATSFSASCSPMATGLLPAGAASERASGRVALFVSRSGAPW